MSVRSPQLFPVSRRLAFIGLGASLLMLPFGSASEAGVLLCLLATLSAVYSGWRPWSQPALRLFGCAWAAYVLAALWSLPDAIDLSRSGETALASLRFAGFGLAAALLDSAQRRRLGGFAACVVGLWTLDALVQAVTGWGLAGAIADDRLSGIFGADDLKLGPVLAACAGLLLGAPFHSRTALRWGLWAALAVAVLLAGARAGWVSFGLVSVWWIARQIRTRGWPLWPLLAGAGVAVMLLGIVLYANVPRFTERVDRTLKLFSTERSEVDNALAFRLPIWETATRMAIDHPLNGVGVRGFRAAYPQYASPGDRFVQLNQGSTGASHPHQIVLELLAETGIPGLLLWLLATLMLIRGWFAAADGQRQRAWPYAVGLLAMSFPLNTHLAFYSSFWGTLLFWQLALYCTELRDDPS